MNRLKLSPVFIQVCDGMRLNLTKLLFENTAYLLTSVTGAYLMSKLLNRDTCRRVVPKRGKDFF